MPTLTALTDWLFYWRGNFVALNGTLSTSSVLDTHFVTVNQNWLHSATLMSCFDLVDSKNRLILVLFLIASITINLMILKQSERKCNKNCTISADAFIPQRCSPCRWQHLAMCLEFFIIVEAAKTTAIVMMCDLTVVRAASEVVDRDKAADRGSASATPSPTNQSRVLQNSQVRICSSPAVLNSRRVFNVKARVQ